jgi:hypothetical protein
MATTATLQTLAAAIDLAAHHAREANRSLEFAWRIRKGIATAPNALSSARRQCRRTQDALDTAKDAWRSEWIALGRPL